MESVRLSWVSVSELAYRLLLVTVMAATWLLVSRLLEALP